MRIGFFTSIEGWGGSETYLLSVMLGVREAGHVPVLFGMDGSRLYREAMTAGIDCVAWKTCGREERGCNRSEVQSHELPAMNRAVKLKRFVLRLIPYFLKLLLGNAREVRVLRKAFSNHRVDVMHVSSSGYEMAGVACRLCGIPSLVMNMITPPPESYWFRRWLMRITLRFYNHISSQSGNCTEEWIRFARLNPDRCSFVWNGVNLTRFKTNETKLRDPASIFKIVAIGRLHPMKGFRYLIEAVGLLADPRVYVDILGSGAEERELQDLIKTMKLTERVVLHGHVETPEDYLRKADCFVLPSISHESCPAVVPEAMACGLPVITSDFGPLAEINVGNETGIVVPTRNASALAQAIKRLVEHPEDGNCFAANGMKRAHEYFSRERMMNSLLNIYHGLLLASRRDAKVEAI